MVIKNTFLLLICLAATALAVGQTYERTDYGIRTTIDGKRIELQFFGPSAVRVLRSPNNAAPVKQSLAVTAQPQKVPCTISRASYAVFVRTESLQVALHLGNGMIVFSTARGKTLLSEVRSGTTFVPTDDAGSRTYRVSQGFTLEPGEAIYGLGQQQEGRMNQRGVRVNMIQGNTDDYIPFFQSVKGYGVFWDNTSPTLFTDSAGATTFASEVGECADYYFLYGGNADGVIARMRDLTGQVPMFPLWTYGYWQSRERYKSQFEIVDVVKRYRALGVPLDGIIQDWQYWGDNFHWNEMRFLNPQFPEPQKMVDSIHAMNAHVIISVWASFGTQTPQFAAMKDKGMLMHFKTWPPSSKDAWPPDPAFPSGVQVYDAYNPEARDIFWRHLNAGLFSTGIDGWWLDSSEPDHLDFTPSDFDNTTFLGSFRKVRNAFPLVHVGGIYDHQRATTPEKRVFILTRSAFAGQQRYGSNVWSGDVVATWPALRAQISAGLNMSLSGVPYWNSDIGGFFLWRFKKGLADPLYRELYVRWIQFGAFCPMMRSHGTDAPREIYQFGRQGEPVYDAIEKAINLRYALLPYVYSLAGEVTGHQSTMMRALVMDFPGDRKVLDIDNEYMFGRSLLVCPITAPMYVDTLVNGTDTSVVADHKTVQQAESYLPAGVSWLDFWTGARFSGGQTVRTPAPIDIIPVFVKAGSILLMGPTVQYATEKKWDTLEVRVYPGADGQAILYEDENDNYNYENGAYSTIAFTWDDAAGVLTIGDCNGTFPGMPEKRLFRVVRVRPGKGTGLVPAAAPDAVVRYAGTSMKVTLNVVH